MNFLWPIPANLVGAVAAGLKFGAPRTTTNPPHDHTGVDLAWGEQGGEVYAAAAGTVTAANLVSGLGGPALIYIDHGNGWQTRYLHLDPTFNVAKGDNVEAGQVIGWIGALSSGPHLHFEIAQDGARLDPETMLGAAAGVSLFGLGIALTIAYFWLRS